MAHPDNHVIYLNYEDETHLDVLKQDILENGIIHLPVCRYKGDEYILVDGHRRLAAIRALVEEGHQQFASIDIKVVDFDNSTDEREFMLSANVKVRKPSEYTRMMQIAAYASIYDERRKNHQSVKGLSKPSYIAKHMQMSERQVNKFLYIRNNFDNAYIKQLLEDPSNTINSFYSAIKSKGDEFDQQFQNKPGLRLQAKKPEQKQLKLNKKEKQLTTKLASDLQDLIQTNEKVLVFLQNDRSISVRLKRLTRSLLTTEALLRDLIAKDEA